MKQENDFNEPLQGDCPDERLVECLKSALGIAPDDFKVNLAQSLRARGARISGYPCEKLKPTKQTKLPRSVPRSEMER